MLKRLVVQCVHRSNRSWHFSFQKMEVKRLFDYNRYVRSIGNFIGFCFNSCRFVSTPNIDDYSSEDSSMAEDMLTLPHLHRRRNAIVSSVSICDSEVSLSESIQQSSGMAGSTALSVLSDENRAVSCSDLWLEFGDKTKQRVSGRSDDSSHHVSLGYF